MTETIRARTDADFLAVLPMLAGYTARNSIVCALFHGGQARAAFRVKLPTRKRAADYRMLADQIISVVRRDPAADRVVLVIYTDESFASAHGIPLPELADEVSKRVHRAGLHITGSFVVAYDGWGDYFEQPTRRRRPLSEITDNPRAPVGLPDIDALGLLPEPDPAVTRELSVLMDSVADIPDLHDAVEALLQPDASTDLLADVVALAQSPANRDVMALQIAFGRIVGEAVAERGTHLTAIQAVTGESMDDLVTREISAGRLSLDDELDGLFIGRGRVRPDAHRVDEAIHLLGMAAVNIDRELRPPVLCMVGWLIWARGLSSASAIAVQAALPIDPNDGMAKVLMMLLDSGLVPEWAMPQ